MKKFCNGCKKHLSSSRFNKICANRPQLRWRCKKCDWAYQVRWRKSKAGKNSLRLSRVKFFYGVDKMTYTKALREQNNCCAICRKPFDETPRVDHDHKTGNFRGLLCDYCNTGLGKFRDNPKALRNAAKYLVK